MSLPIDEETEPQLEALRDELAATPADSPDYPIAVNRLGTRLRQAGQLQESEEVLRDGLSKVSASSSDHATVANNLGTTLWHSGKLDEAVAVQQAVLNQPGLKEGATRAWIGTTNNLAVYLRAAGRSEEAAVRAREAITVSVDALGEEHPLTLASQSNLALALADLGQFDEAIATQQLVVASHNRSSGTHDPRTIGAIQGLVKLHRAAGDPSQAVALIDEVMERHTPTTDQAPSEAMLAMVMEGADLMNEAGNQLRATDFLESASQLSEELHGNNAAQLLMGANESRRQIFDL